MKLNFTIELPCKDHENCYNLEVDGEQQIVNYQVDSQPQLTNGVTTVNLGQVTNFTSTNYKKITITEKFTRRILKKLKVPLQKPLEEIQEFEELDEILNKEYNELVYKHNDVVDTNENLQKLTKDLKHELSIKHPDPKDTMEYKNLLQQYESQEELHKIQLERLQDKLIDKENQSGFDQQLREQKFKELTQDNQDLNNKVQTLQDQIKAMEEQRDKLQQEKKDVQQALDDKYDHFEEMNKYINDLLLEKKERLIKLEERDRKIKELEFDLDNIVRQQANMETKSGSQPNSLGENSLKKYANKVSNANKFISALKGKKDPKKVNLKSENNINEILQEYKQLNEQIQNCEEIVKQLPEEDQKVFVKYKKNTDLIETKFSYKKQGFKITPTNQQSDYSEIVKDNQKLAKMLKQRDDFIKSLPKNLQDDFQKYGTFNQLEETQNRYKDNQPYGQNDKALREKEKQIQELQRQLKNLKDFIKQLPEQYQQEYQDFINNKNQSPTSNRNKSQDQISFLDELIKEKEKLEKENQAYKKFIESLPPQQQKQFEAMKNQSDYQYKKPTYINDPQLLIMLEQKNEQLELQEQELENLQKQNQDNNNNYNNNKPVTKTIIKPDPLIQQKLDEAFEHIKQLENQNDDLRTIIQDKEKEADELEKVLEDVKKQIEENQPTEQKNKVKEVKNIYLKPKERTKEWQEAHDTTQSLVKAVRDLLVYVSGESNIDNLDMEITKKDAPGFLRPIVSYNKKGQRYVNEIKILFEESKRNKEKIDELKDQVQNYKQNMDIEEIKDIYDSTQHQVENLIEILKMSKKQPFVDYQKQNIDSDKIDHYLEAILKNFNDCQEFYKKIRQELEAKNKEYKELKDFQKNVNAGLNKDICYEDFKAILSKNIKLNKQIGDLVGLVSDDEDYKMMQLKIQDPQTADDTIDQIFDAFNIGSSTTRDIVRMLDDLKEEKKSLQKKLEEAKKKQVDLDQSSLKALVKKEIDNQKKIQDILGIVDTQPFSNEQINFADSNKPQDIINQANKINDQNMLDLNQLKSVVEEQNQQIEKLKDYEKQAKTGQQQNVSVLNDLKYVLNKNIKLYKVAFETYQTVYEEEDKPFKKFEVNEDDQNQDIYIDKISKSIKESQNLIDSVQDNIKQNKEKLDKLVQFEKDILSGKNKDNCKEDLENIFYKTKKNTKNLLNVYDKTKPLESDSQPLWKSTVISNPSSQEYIEGIIENLKKQELCNKQLQDAVDTMQKQNRDLEKFKQDVDSGKNKESCLEDFKIQFQHAQQINEKAREALAKITQEEIRPAPKPDFYNNDSKEHIEAINVFNEKTKQILNQLRDNIYEVQNESAKLKIFQNDVITGKNKIAAKNDFKEIAQQHSNILGMIKEIFKDEKIEDDIDKPRAREINDSSSAEDMFDQIADQNELLRKYVKKLKARIQDLHDQLQSQVSQNTNTAQELTEITTEREQLKQKFKEIEIKTATYEEEYQQIVTVFEHAQENQILINRLLEVVSKGEIMEKVTYKVNKEERKEVISTSLECLVFNKNKLETLGQLLKNYSSNDSMVLLNVLQQLENYKYSFREIYNQVLDDDLPDNSGVIMSQAKDSEQILDFIYKNIKYLGQELFTFQNEIADKTNIIIQAKNQILNEKSKLKLQVDDLQFEINKKTTLIGKLQVKLYMLISILDFLEQQKNN